LTLDKMPFEIMQLILSYLHVLDFFPLKLVNRYTYNIVSQLPRLTFSDYIAELEAEDRRRRGDGQLSRSAIEIAASQGQEGLLIRLQEIAATSSFKRIGWHNTTPSPLSRMIDQLNWQRHKRQFMMRAEGRMLRTPLHWAAENGQTALVRRLTRNGVINWSRDRDGKSPIDLAAQNGHSETVMLLLEISKGRLYLQTRAFHIAVENGQKGVIRILLDAGIDVDVRDEVNLMRTALHFAAMKGLDEVVCLLLDRGASLEAKDGYNLTALTCARLTGQQRTVKLLLARGANGEERPASHCNETTLLHGAASVGDVEMVRLLLDQGAEVDAKDGFGKTPLLHAAACGHANRLPLVSLLLERGADVNTKDVGGRTALHIVMMWSNWELWSDTRAPLVSLLLRQGADVNARDNRMQTPLHLAAETGRETIYKLLKARGADEYARDSWGRCPKSKRSVYACMK
jgi:ankyrin repeat protein